jgi:hypothetical protein
MKKILKKAKSLLSSIFSTKAFPKRLFTVIFHAQKQENPVREKKGSGRPPKIATKSNINMLSKLFNKTCGLSKKSAAVTLKCSQEYISIMLNKHTSIRCLNKSRKPLRTPSQLKNMRPFCRKHHKNH